MAGSLVLPGVAVADPSDGGANQHGSTAEEATSGSGANETNAPGNAGNATGTSESPAASEGNDDGDATSPTEAGDVHATEAPAAASGNGAETGTEGAGSAEDETDAGTQGEAPGQAPQAGDGPTATAEQGAAVDQGVSATAVAEQQGQGDGSGNTYGHGNGNGNPQTDVRIDDPGSAEDVSQLNQAGATADATASTAVDSGGTATVTQSADASAAATQDGIGNVHVSVRVGSPGDDGDVTQINQAGAASSATVDVEAPDGGTVDQTGASQADATATQQGVSNTVVSVRVGSPGDDGNVTQTNEADANASADDATATVTQDGVRNTYVGIRVESPGERGELTQSSIGNATTTPGGTVAVTTDGLDTAVVADISAPELSLPGKTAVWEWVWVWNADESTLDDAASTTLSGDSWNWTWGDLPGGTLIQREATDVQPGTWTWDWAWNRDVQGWAWNWAQTSALACATCAWVWDWDWNWVGESDKQAVTATVNTENPTNSADHAASPSTETESEPTQATTATAAAVARGDASVGQVVEQDDAPVQRFAGQIATLAQVVDASAVAQQRLADADATAGGNRVGRRSLVVVAESDASAAVDQFILQSGDVSDRGDADQWAGQQAEVSQVVSADALGGQELGSTGAVDGAAVAHAAAVSSNVQSAAQDAKLRDGQLAQWSGQLAQVLQIVGAGAMTTQQARHSKNVSASSRAVSTDLALADQTVAQVAARRAGIGTQTAAQLAQVAQDAEALASTSQTVRSDEDATVARSAAVATNRSIVLQTGVQAMNGTAAIDIQELQQDALVVQFAFAASTSSGGIGGTATTVNCATTQQAASQGIGWAIAVDVSDLSAFCAPPAVPGQGSDDGGGQGGSTARLGVDATVVEHVTSVVVESTPGTPTRQRHGVADCPIGRDAPSDRVKKFSTAGAEGVHVAPRSTEMRSQVSSPAPSQARFDTRPKGSAGAKGVDGESPLPATDGPPTWVSALAQSGAGSGGTGLAIGMSPLVLEPTLLRRVREEAVVRRPASLFTPLDVPV